MELNKQYIYILSNPENSGILKIGKTKVSPIGRALQLSRQTGVVGEYKLEYSIEVPDCDLGEKIAHYCLKEFHYKKEFYKVDLEVAIKQIEIKIFHFFDIDYNFVSYNPVDLKEIEEAIEGLNLLLELSDEEGKVEIRNAINDLENSHKKMKINL